MKTRSKLIVSIVALVTTPALLFAQAHYVPGVEGLKGASLPPPGFYVRDYNVFYFANQLNDPSGHIKGSGPIIDN